MLCTRLVHRKLNLNLELDFAFQTSPVNSPNLSLVLCGGTNNLWVHAMICWSRVNELRDEVGCEDFDEVLEIFFEEVDEVIDRLRASPNPKTYEADLHFLKGSALNLGFSEFAELCGKGEKTASENNAESIDLSAVFQSYENSQSEFSAGEKCSVV